MTTNGPLILGSTGHVGRALQAVWPPSVPATWQHRQAGRYAWDILEEPAPEVPKGTTGIVCLAGVTHGDALETNTKLALAACALGARERLPVLIASSQAVYGPMEHAAKESDECLPLTPYGHAKLDMEHAVSFAPNVTVLRISNVAGCDSLLRNATLGMPMKLDQFANGTSPSRCYISPIILRDVLLHLLANPSQLPRVLNITQPGTVTMADLLRAANVSWKFVAAGPHALAALDLDSTLLTSLMNVPVATPEQLIADARAAGWRPA